MCKFLPNFYLKGSERKQQMAKEYREKVEKELRDICNDVLVSTNLITCIFKSINLKFYIFSCSGFVRQISNR